MSLFNPDHDARPIHAAAAEWAKTCLLNDGSILQPGFSLWTADLLDELDVRFVQNLDEGEGTFFEKLRGQLLDGSPACKRLMAEALWILMLFQSNISPATKRENVLTVWASSGADRSSARSEMLTDAVLLGLGSTGRAFNAQRWRELDFLITSVRAFKRTEQGQRAALLNDPWEFAQWIAGRPGAANRLHLAERGVARASDAYSALVAGEAFDVILFAAPYWNRVADDDLERSCFDEDYQFFQRAILEANSWLAEGGTMYVLFSDQGEVGRALRIIGDSALRVEEMHLFRPSQLGGHIRIVWELRRR